MTLDPRTATLTAGALYMVMALVVWSLHLGRPRLVWPARLWALGAVSMGAGVTLVGLRDMVPAWASVGLQPALIIGSLALRILALSHFAGRPLHAGRVACVLALVAAGHAAVGLWPDLRVRAAYHLVMVMAGTGLFAVHAWRAAQCTGSRNARVIAGAEALLVSALAARLVAVLLGAAPAQAPGVGWDWALVLAVGAVAAMYGNAGYLGLVLDDSERAHGQALHAQRDELARRRSAEAQAGELQRLLAERDRLSAEREHLLQLLAHEIRQPLHSASGALQATAEALHRLPPVASEPATRRLQQAQAVLGGVRSVLDNTLAAATLLARTPRQQPMQRQEVALDFLAELVLGDLCAEQRSRVQVQWATDLRCADLEPGLLRLALRNLLTNAFIHGGAGVAVRLRLDEQAQPHALRLSVLDNGPGLAPGTHRAGAAGALDVDVDPGPRGPRGRRGLGLRIAREVALRHGGMLELLDNLPRGLCARLVLPLPG